MNYNFKDINSIKVSNGKVWVDGKLLTETKLRDSEIKIVIEGNVYGKVDCGGSVTIGGNCENIDCGGSVKITGDVNGSIDCGGSVTCANVSGSIDAGGSVNIRR